MISVIKYETVVGNQFFFKITPRNIQHTYSTYNLKVKLKRWQFTVILFFIFIKLHSFFIQESISRIHLRIDYTVAVVLIWWLHWYLLFTCCCFGFQIFHVSISSFFKFSIKWKPVRWPKLGILLLLFLFLS